MKLISIEGNIGSGKSTIINLLKKFDHIVFLPEPVEEWTTITDLDGKNIIEKYYADQKRYAFPFQMMAYITRLKQLLERPESDCIVITERCVYTDREIFAKMLYDTGLIEEIEYSIYLRWFDFFIKNIEVNNFIYLRTDPEICEKRITHRNRKGETIPLEYLVKCHQYHEKWLNGKENLIILDGNINHDGEIPNEWLLALTELITQKV